VPALLRLAGRSLAGLLVFDVVGVLLTLLADVAGLLHRHWEVSTPLGYVIWFVVGVLCAFAIYLRSDDGGVRDDSPAGRRRGTQLVFACAAVAVLLGALSSLVWSSGEAAEPVAPDHRDITITYLVTVVATVAWIRFVLFRERSADAGPGPGSVAAAPAAAPRASGSLVPPTGAPAAEPPFIPAGFRATLGCVLGVPVLLFLDASFFLLGPFDVFDRWTDVILGTALIGGLAWGLGCARRRGPREWLLMLHAPLLIGAVFYFFALLAGGVLVAVGVPERVAEILATVGFAAGFLVGAVAVAGGLAERIERWRRA